MDIQSQFSMSKNVRIILFFSIEEYQFRTTFFVKYIFLCINFKMNLLLKWRLIFCNNVLSQYKNKHFSTFDFFVKMNLVSTVRHINVTISKYGYWQAASFLKIHGLCCYILHFFLRRADLLVCQTAIKKLRFSTL